VPRAQTFEMDETRCGADGAAARDMVRWSPTSGQVIASDDSASV